MAVWEVATAFQINDNVDWDEIQIYRRSGKLAKLADDIWPSLIAQAIQQQACGSHSAGIWRVLVSMGDRALRFMKQS